MKALCDMKAGMSFLLETTLAWTVVSTDLKAPDPQII
jgi:hypothetical protein